MAGGTAPARESASVRVRVPHGDEWSRWGGDTSLEVGLLGESGDEDGGALAGISRVALAPGETADTELRLGADAFRRFHADAFRRFHADLGRRVVVDGRHRVRGAVHAEDPGTMLKMHVAQEAMPVVRRAV